MKKSSRFIWIIAIVIIGGILLYNFFKKKVKEEIKETAEQGGAGLVSGIKSALGIGAKATATGVAGTAAKAAIGTKTLTGTSIAATTGAGGYAGFAGTSTLATVGIAAFMALWAYKFVAWIKGRSLDPRVKAQFEAATAAGKPIYSKVSKVSLKAPDKRT
jgi:hypothetical protein